MRKREINRLLSIMIIVSLMLLSITNYQTSNAAKKMSINKKKLSLTVGATYQLKIKNAKRVTWKSSKKNVVSVSKKGLVFAKKKGTITITGKVGRKKFYCKVTANADEKYKKDNSTNIPTITPRPNIVPTPTVTPTPIQTIGTRANPYPANNNAVLNFQRYSFDNVKNVTLTIESVITGAEANSIINSENMFNEKPKSNQEWRIYTFNLKYISGIEDDVLEASDLIYDRYFYNQKGQSMVIHDTATLGDIYGAYSVFKVNLYPGGSSKVVYAVLTNIDEEIPIIQIQYDKGKKSYWISCNA